MRCSGIGGQAVIEGVMMKNRDEYAVAVRKTNGEIEIKKAECKDMRDRCRIAQVPVIRGIVAFVDSLRMGMNTLNYSASLFEEDDEEEKKEQNGKKDSVLMGLVIVLAVIIAVGIFVIVPFLVGESLRKVIRPDYLRGLIEGVIRVVLFVLYVKMISLMDDIKRVFMYHGAEHKSINCIENGFELTVENVRKQSTQHKRCGTSFLLVVMFISVLFFMIISVDQMWLRMLYRILLIPLIAGIAYEFIRYAGSHDNMISNLFSKPGMWLQGLTTAEPDDAIIEVAIASVNAVYDWKSFVAEFREDQRGQMPENPSEKEKKADKEEVQEAADKTVWRENKAVRSTEAESAKTEMKDTGPEDGGAKTGYAETAAAGEAGIEILAIDDEEEDEILNALDRYFEAPK